MTLCVERFEYHKYHKELFVMYVIVEFNSLNSSVMIEKIAISIYSNELYSIII